MKRLQELRKSQGYSQKELSALFHVSQNTISQWENGTRKPSYESAQDVAKFFHVTVDYLLGDSDTPLSLDKQLEGIDFALYGETKDLTDAEKEKILDFIKFTKSQRK